MRIHRLPYRRLAGPLAVALLLSAASAEPGHDHAHARGGAELYAREWRFLAGFAREHREGLLLRATPEGDTAVVHGREGWHVERIHDTLLGDQRVLLVLWRSHPDGERLSPALWVEGFDGEITDLIHRWPATPGAVEWERPEVAARRRGGHLRLTVARDLVGENRERPRLRKLEVFQVTPEALTLVRERVGTPETPEQTLNAIADRLARGDLDRARALARALPATPPELRQRAAVLFTRLADEEEARAASRELLGAVIDSDSGAGLRAAERLLEMTWEDLVP